MASTDRGSSSYVGPIGLRVSSATDLSTPDTSHGTYSLLRDTHLSDGDRGFSVYFLGGVSGFLLGVVNLQPFFKMQGWYVAGAAWEEWTSSLAPNFTPPSGHTLIAVTYTRLLNE